jgi:hypothetical protein
MNVLRRSIESAGKSRRSVFVLERVKGIEPSFSAWEANVLPLNDTRMSSLPSLQFYGRYTPRLQMFE